MVVDKAYELAKERYAAFGIDTDAAILYVSDDFRFNTSVHVYSLADPLNPALVGLLEFGYRSSRIRLNGDYAYIKSEYYEHQQNFVARLDF